MLRKFLVIALTSGLAARAAKSWLARQELRRRQANGSGRLADEARWADDGGRVTPPAPKG